ncbi:hypothetical protein BJY16_000889 [Actinoplanes octamycinicus]|uniref:Uncharacterized protein n=1 Tax=Actinoplanes octamycinicus TaxID=135948 RepID=A0A7W7M584_9ACTN|nr:hypothetical protein [Actinoplanes octamycinicus]MBB4737430.1 hypothetical protein [Actinoplanes octamycinicus]
MVALALLVVNDHLLKAAFPGPLTGKLSDAAGLVLAPPLLAALTALIIPRLPARRSGPLAMLTVAAGFALVKTFPYAAALASSAWSLLTPSLIRADVTDLLALPALALSWWSLRRARQAPAPIGSRLFRALRVGVLLPLALFAVAATSPVPTSRATDVLATPDGAIHVRMELSRFSGDWAVSHDGGHTWADEPEPVAARTGISDPSSSPSGPSAASSSGPAATSPSGSPAASSSGPAAVSSAASSAASPAGSAAVPAAGARASLPPGSAPAARRSPQVEACTRDQVCYRVVPGRMAVQTRTGTGPWTTSWAVGELDRRVLQHGYGDVYNVAGQLSSVALGVQEVAGGHVVVVANSRDGFAVRDPDGTWRRIGFPLSRFDDDAPYPLTGDQILAVDRWFAAAVAIFGLALSLTVGGALAARRVGAPSRVWLTLLGPLLAGPPLLLWNLIGRLDPDPTITLGTSGFPAGPLLALIGLICVGSVLSAALQRLDRPSSWPARLTTVVAATVAAHVIAYLAWLRIGLTAERYLYLSYLLFCLAGLTGMIWASRAARPRPVLPWMQP